MKFSEFIDYILSNKSSTQTDEYYLNLQEPDERVITVPLSVLTNDFSLPSFFISAPTVAINLWMGSSDPEVGQKSGLHHDYENNLYVLIKGRKKVKLYSPEDSFNLYPIGKIIDISHHGSHYYCNERDSHWSQITCETPESTIKEKFPRYLEAKPLYCEVNEGEMLYIPPGWWHEVTSYGNHIALNFWIQVFD